MRKRYGNQLLAMARLIISRKLKLNMLPDALQGTGRGQAIADLRNQNRRCTVDTFGWPDLPVIVFTTGKSWCAFKKIEAIFKHKNDPQ